jgi:conjugative transposon TraM protein
VEAKKDDNIFLLQPDTGVAGNRFYSLDDSVLATALPNAIPAVVQEDQTLVSGAVIKLRLGTDVLINGMRIAAGQFLYGNCALKAERLHIRVETIRCGENIIPVALSVYDLDGLEGIYIPGAITRDVAKQSAAQSVQSISMLGGLDPSIGAQAASAGIQAAQTMLSKKAKLLKVAVTAGYQVLLKDENRREK